MAFDANLPANNSPISSAELRNQLNGLKTLIDAQAAQIAGLQTALAGKASAITSVDTSNTDIDNPVTQEQGQALLDKLNELIVALKA